MKSDVVIVGGGPGGTGGDACHRVHHQRLERHRVGRRGEAGAVHLHGDREAGARNGDDAGAPVAANGVDGDKRRFPAPPRPS